MTGKNYERISITGKDGKEKAELVKPAFGELTMRNEGGRTVIEKTGLWGRTTTYVPSTEESIEAEE